MQTITEALNWRYATKKFDSTSKLTDEQVQQLKEAANLTASSYGLQPYRIIDVRTPAIREQLKAAAYGQQQITEASHLFVFAAYKDLTEQHIDEFLVLTANERGIALEALSGYGSFMKGTFAQLSQSDKHNWSARQAYIAIGNLMDVAATMGIDTCPMEGFDPSGFDQILDLNDTNLSSVVVLTLGHRSPEDDTQSAAKVRIPVEEMFVVV
jgi:nitroreductase/dihydropteridine reductase